MNYAHTLFSTGRGKVCSSSSKYGTDYSNWFYELFKDMDSWVTEFFDSIYLYRVVKFRSNCKKLIEDLETKYLRGRKKCKENLTYQTHNNVVRTDEFPGLHK